ncbi:hypothetical protein ACIBHY_49510 [Nonomuraea sp. NPDC050547]|uniref:hypothetical protein n=1 Tax=Nonomuraea sp. NPDC050547 TaxID=3364368 RepID=UPI0037B9F2BE
MRVHLLVPAVVLLAASSGVLPMGGESAGVMTYTCTTTATAQTQEIRVNVDLTVPPTAKVGEQMTIGWRGSYAGGGELIAPIAGLKLYVYAGISKIDKLTSATGVATLPEIAAGEPIPLPESVVELKTTPKQTGSGSVHPASFNLGTSPSARAIECEVKARGAGLDYPLTVEGGTTPTDAETEQPDETVDDAETVQSDEPVDEVKTPVGGAETGGGGEAGPDGRIVVLAGLVMLAGAGAGLARRTRSRG